MPLVGVYEAVTIVHEMHSGKPTASTYLSAHVRTVTALALVAVHVYAFVPQLTQVAPVPYHKAYVASHALGTTVVAFVAVQADALAWPPVAVQATHVVPL